MRRVVILTAVAALCIGAAPRIAAAGPGDDAGATARRATAAVTALSVVPASGKAEVVIGVDGTVEVQDFILSGPDRVVLDLHGASLGMPARLYDKIVRGGIANVRVAQYKDDVVRVVIDMNGPWDYEVVRGEGDVRVTVDGGGAKFKAWHTVPTAATRAEAARRAPDTTPAIARRDSYGGMAVAVAQPRITVTYQDANVLDVLAAFAAFSGRTIIAGKDVKGEISAEIRDQPWDVALASILASQGLAAQEDQYGIITVDSYDNILAKQATEPLVTQIVPVNYARATALQKTVQTLLSKDCRIGQGGQQGACTVRGNVVADTSTNSLLVTEVPSRMNELLSYVRDLDVRTPQVNIKAKIILINRTNTEALGLKYDLGGRGTFFNRLVQRLDTLGRPLPADVNQIELGGRELAAIANANQPVATPALSLIYSTMIGRYSLTAFLDALRSASLSDIQAEPSITTLDNMKAEILVGEETPIRVLDMGNGSGNARANVQFKETGIILGVTPHITNNRQVLMTVHAERSSLEILAETDLGFTFRKQRADNQLLVGDGETAVIGGLTQTLVTSARAGLPFLVDLPLIGRLFGSTSRREEKVDLLILITPHIVDEGEVPGGE
jgi:type IV pilus assembly protein PilQ